MFRLIRQLIGLAVIAAIIFLVLSFWQGGKPFRWLGKKSEQAGEVVKKKSEELGKEADRIKGRTEDIKDTTTKVGEGLRKTREKIKDFTGTKEKEEKTH
jgi:hypothetical protein